MKQNILKFNFKFKNNDFFVTEKNIFAYNLVKVWPKWNNQLFISMVQKNVVRHSYQIYG